MGAVGAGAGRDPQAKGAVERLQGLLGDQLRAGGSSSTSTTTRPQLDAWFAKANAGTHRMLRRRPVDRLIAEREPTGAPLEFPDLDRRPVTRVPADPYLRFDTCDYSFDPRLAGRRVEVRVSQTEVKAVALDTGELGCRHKRSFRALSADLRSSTPASGSANPTEPASVETRPLARYDALTA